MVVNLHLLAQQTLLEARWRGLKRELVAVSARLSVLYEMKSQYS